MYLNLKRYKMQVLFASVCDSMRLSVRTIQPEITITGIAHHESWLATHLILGQGHRVTKCRHISTEGDRVAGVSLHPLEWPLSCLITWRTNSLLTEVMYYRQEEKKRSLVPVLYVWEKIANFNEFYNGAMNVLNNCGKKTEVRHCLN